MAKKIDKTELAKLLMSNNLIIDDPEVQAIVEELQNEKDKKQEEARELYHKLILAFDDKWQLEWFLRSIDTGRTHRMVENRLWPIISAAYPDGSRSIRDLLSAYTDPGWNKMSLRGACGDIGALWGYIENLHYRMEKSNTKSIPIGLVYMLYVLARWFNFGISFGISNNIPYMYCTKAKSDRYGSIDITFELSKEIYTTIFETITKEWSTREAKLLKIVVDVETMGLEGWVMQDA